MGLSVPESQVVLWLKQSLRRRGLYGEPARQILVDADGSYLKSPFRRQLEPTGTLWIGDWRPDLVCAVDRGYAEWLIAFEVKADADHEKGIVQASRYRLGAHAAYLCVPGHAADVAPWLRDVARSTGVGIVSARPETAEVCVEAAAPLPEPSALVETRRYLLGEASVRAFGLNKPLHYAAALMAYVSSPDPTASMVAGWGLRGSAVAHAIRGAETLGLLQRGGGATLRGQAFADVLKAVGLDLTRDRALTRRRLVQANSAYAAVLRAMLLDHPVIDFVVRALANRLGGQATASQLASAATAEDPALARAVFGEPDEFGRWISVRPATRFNLKAMLYDSGVLDSPLARGAGNAELRGGYDAEKDLWRLGSVINR